MCSVVGSHDPGILSWTPRVLHASQTHLHGHGALITEVKGGDDDLEVSVPPTLITIVLFGLTLSCTPWILSPLNGS